MRLTTTSKGAMNCAAFDAALLDVVYDELDEAETAAADAHAESCAPCATNAAGLRSTRRLLSHLVVPPPVDLEARILDAVDVATSAHRREHGARVFAWLARPPLAIAASVLLLVAASAALFGTSSKREPLANTERAVDFTIEGAPPSASTDTAVAALEQRSVTTASAAPPSATASPKAGGKERHRDPAFDEAKALFDARRFGEAKPRFEALAATNAKAGYYAARCSAELGDCKDAAPKLDAFATENEGTREGSRARLDAARCYRALGEPQAADARYRALADDPFVATEAKSEQSKPTRIEPAATRALPRAAPPPNAITNPSAPETRD